MPQRQASAVKGSVHAAIGASAPIGLVMTRDVTLFQGVVMAGISAGYALLPDLDHRDSKASQALGSLAHKAVHGFCKKVVDRSSTDRDRKYTTWLSIRHRGPYHRTFTHTLAATLAIGLIAYGLAWLGTAAIGFLASLGVLLLWPLYRKTIGPVVLSAAAAAVGAVLFLTPWLMALAVGGGYFSHIVADACTKTGVPALWPLRIRGKRWWNIRLLSSMVASGSAQEKGPAVGVSLASNALLLFLYF